jgi:hypothetical protein
MHSYLVEGSTRRRGRLYSDLQSRTLGTVSGDRAECLVAASPSCMLHPLLPKEHMLGAPHGRRDRTHIVILAIIQWFSCYKTNNSLSRVHLATQPTHPPLVRRISILRAITNDSVLLFLGSGYETLELYPVLHQRVNHAETLIKSEYLQELFRQSGYRTTERHLGLERRGFDDSPETESGSNTGPSRR